MDDMTTLTITKARANLSQLLEKAKKGEDIGIVSGDQIVALRPVTVSSDDYAWREYGVTPAEIKRFEERVEREIASERKRSKVKRFSGDLKKDLAD
jgi:antitoxin (DNA-binding transcriptional repressor) of toxin-antitoxin stability system